MLYEIPNIFARQKIDDYICRHLDLKTAPLDLSRWNEMVAKIKNLRGEVKIGLVGEYVSLKDAYISVNESIKHGAFANETDVKITAIDSGELTAENVKEKLSGLQGIVVPGGLGSNNVNGALAAVRYARENKIPFLGICFGMRLAVLEYARNVLGFDEASAPLFTKTGEKTARCGSGFMTAI